MRTKCWTVLNKLLYLYSLKQKLNLSIRFNAIIPYIKYHQFKLQ